MKQKERVKKRTLPLEGQVSEVLWSQRYRDPNYRSVLTSAVERLALEVWNEPILPNAALSTNGSNAL